MKKRFSAIILMLLFALLLACVQAAVVPQDGYIQDYVRDDPVQSTPVQSDPDPVRDDPIQSDPVQGGPVQDATDPIQDDPVQDEPDAGQDDPVRDDPAQRGPVQNVTIQNSSQDDYIAANHTRGNGKPYYIMVNRAQNTVTIYGLDDNGYYTVPVKAMICSTGRKGHSTPTGTYTIGGKWQWIHMVDGSYGQYNTQIKGDILFHSVCYNKKDPSTLITEEYNGLGERASLGCVRLQTEDAKWIYDNCAPGTKVTVYDGTSPGPLGKPSRLVDYIDPDHPASGWDPTDPREENPWRAILAESASDAGPAEPDGEDGNSGDIGISGFDPDGGNASGAGPAEPDGKDGNSGDAGIPGLDPDDGSVSDAGPAEPGAEDGNIEDAGTSGPDPDSAAPAFSS